MTRVLADNGRVRGEFYATGYVPTFIYDFVTHGLAREDDDLL